MLSTFQGYKMKRLICGTFDSLQEALEYEKNKPYSLEEYCKTLDYSKADTINFEEWAKKEGFAYDDATKANWDYRYERFEKEEKIEMFKKKKEEKKDSFLDKAQKFLKECYDKGAIIEYEESEGKWVDLPKGLPIDFSKFDEGKIRLKLNDPTYSQVKQFKEEYGSPIVTDWEFKNIPMLAFCYNKGFCRVLSTKVGKRLEWDPMKIWRYYGVKEYLPETPITEVQETFKKKKEDALNRLVSLDEYCAYLPPSDEAFFKTWLKINKPAVLSIFEPIRVSEIKELYTEYMEDTKPISLRDYCNKYFDESQSDKVKAFIDWATEKKRIEVKPRRDWAKLYMEFSPEYEDKKLDENYEAVETEEQSIRNKMLDSIVKEMKGLTDKAAIRTFMSVIDYVRWEFHNIDEKIEDLYARTKE